MHLMPRMKGLEARRHAFRFYRRDPNVSPEEGAERFAATLGFAACEDER